MVGSGQGKPKEKLRNRIYAQKSKFKGCKGGYWDSINKFGGLRARPWYCSVTTHLCPGGHG